MRQWAKNTLSDLKNEIDSRGQSLRSSGRIEPSMQYFLLFPLQIVCFEFCHILFGRRSRKDPPICPFVEEVNEGEGWRSFDQPVTYPIFCFEFNPISESPMYSFFMSG